MSQAVELFEYLGETESLAVVCHGNPDPDCIASALAVETIAKEAGVADTRIFYSGGLGHQQDRAFVNLLAVDMETMTAATLEGFERVALVDHSTPRTALLEANDVDVVIDAHSVTEPVDAAFVDRHEEYRATTTMLVEYLDELEIEIDSRLASALLFALHRTCLDFVRRPTVREYRAALELYPRADLELIDQMYGAAFTHATMDAIGEAIRSRVVRGSTLVASVRRTSEEGALAQAADYLLALEGVDTVLVFGSADDGVRLSARSIDPRVDIVDVLRRGFGDMGDVNGEQGAAGGTIELGFLSESADRDAVFDLVTRRVHRRFFDALRVG